MINLDLLLAMLAIVSMHHSVHMADSVVVGDSVAASKSVRILAAAEVNTSTAVRLRLPRETEASPLNDSVMSSSSS